MQIRRKLSAIKKQLRLIKCWGSFRRLEPFSRVLGYDRGTQSIARYYIDNFYTQSAAYIKGNILEIGDDTYTKRHGLSVLKSDVLHVVEGNPKATVVADLTKPNQIPDNFYDCVILPQTLPFIYDYKAALKDAYRILKPGGAMLVTLSGISQISRYDMDRWGDYWRFTSKSARMDFESLFSKENIKVQTYGNVLSTISFLEGLASKELKKKELDYCDPDYEMIISVLAIK